MAIIGLDTAIFAAPDMGKARKFFTDWGLNRVSTSKSKTVFETEIGSQVILMPPGARNLPPAPVKGMNFREMIWGVSSKTHLKQITKELAKDRDVTTDRDGTIHCFDPNGLCVGFRLWKRTRKPKTPATAINSHGSYQRVDELSRIYERARPIAMGHIGFIVPDLKSAEDFYHKRLGFPVSDRYAGGAALFLRCQSESEHHNLFLIWSKEGKTSFHHVAFEVRDIHEVFGGGLYFDKQGWPTQVGPGRHPVSSAYFWYFDNPCDGAVEYYTDSDYVTDAWKPHNYRNNRFSEWHMVDGIRQRDDGVVRPSMAATGK